MAAAYLDVSEPTIFRRMKKGLLSFYKGDAVQYRKRDLRAIDMFGLILTGIGLLFLLLGLLSLAKSGKVDRVSASKEAPPANIDAEESAPEAEGKGIAPGKAAAMRTEGRSYGMLLIGLVFLCLGLALNLGLRRVLKNKGQEVLEPHDEPESPEPRAHE